ncbi:MAG: hypothetical protein JWP11_68 [Frankiales bacterium]|jgi:hypothetical protein|nr:hypothetical protein [Frankiales bacterium]
MVRAGAHQHCSAMDVGVSLECKDCGGTMGLPADDGGYLFRARSFVAAHQLCSPRSVTVHVLPAPSLVLVEAGVRA